MALKIPTRGGRRDFARTRLAVFCLIVTLISPAAFAYSSNSSSGEIHLPADEKYIAALGLQKGFAYQAIIGSKIVVVQSRFPGDCIFNRFCKTFFVDLNGVEVTHYIYGGRMIGYYDFNGRYGRVYWIDSVNKRLEIIPTDNYITLH